MSAKGKEHEAVVKRVSRKHEDEGHGGSWKVAFADFCLALMCLFLVLWVLAARDKEELQMSLQDAGSKMMEGNEGVKLDNNGGPRGSLIERHPVQSRGENVGDRHPQPEARPLTPSNRLAKTQYETADDMEELARFIAHLSEQAGLAANLQTVVTPYGLRVMVHDTEGKGMFERGSATPSEHFRALLREMGPMFAQIDNQLLVVGHTDSLQYAGGERSMYSNWTLSTNRAMAARLQLMQGGMPTRSVLQVVGMADRAPLDDTNTAAAKNRRIELLILTSEQARLTAAMFGMPGETIPLMKGVESALPEREAIDALRGNLRGAPVGAAR